MFDLNLAISIGTLLVVLYIFLNLNKIIAAKTTDLKQDLTQNLDQYREELVDRVVDKINQSSQQQISHLSDNKAQVDLRFQQLQNNISMASNQQSQSQKDEFGQIKSLNQQSLIELQKQIQDSLSKAISDLSHLTSQNFETLRKTNQEKLDQINTEVSKRLDENFAQHLKSFDEVTKNVGQVQSLAQRMIDSTGSIDRLNSVFARTSSKAFGDFGEKYLESLLRENLNSSSWSSQVSVPNSSEKIDFVISIQGKKLGIDSKFPLTKYQDYLEAKAESKAAFAKEFLNAVTKMADDIAKKYSKVGFVDYLFLYLPSDSMYTMIADNETLIASLQKKGVTPISPITIFPIILGIKTYQHHDNINENAEIIIKSLKNIGKNIVSFQDEFRKLGAKLKNAQDNYELADRSLTLVSKEIKLLDNKEQEVLAQTLL
jgi:DNA recombination protein RmuC